MKTDDFIKRLKELLDSYDSESEAAEETAEAAEEVVNEVSEEGGTKEVVRTETETVTVDTESGERTVESKITFKDGEYYGI